MDLRSAIHDEAIQALRQTTNVVRILVLRGKLLTEMTNEQEKFDIITIDLMKKSGKGLGKHSSKRSIDQEDVFFDLGFSIIGRRHGHGVFISHIVSPTKSHTNDISLLLFLARRGLCGKRRSINVGRFNSRSQWTGSSNSGL